MSPRPVLPDLLESGLDLVICGMAAGTHSAKAGAYYAHGSNKFWRVLAETGLTPRRLAPGEFASLAKLRLGLTDLAKRASGSDSALRKRDLDIHGFRDKILSMRPRVLAFNGKNAAMRALERRSVEYGRRVAESGRRWYSCCPRLPTLRTAAGTPGRGTTVPSLSASTECPVRSPLRLFPIGRAHRHRVDDLLQGVAPGGGAKKV